MRLTPRDLEILRQVSRYRFLNSAQIRLLMGGSMQQILRRLHRLFHAGYLDRPRAQVRYFSEAGSQPMIYGLGRAGARVLYAADSRPKPNHQVRQLYLQHTLLVADTMIAFAHACRKSHGAWLLLEEDLAPYQLPGAVFRWTVTIKDKAESKRIGVFPDRTFALENLIDQQRTLYFLEADRATMPISRRSLNQSSFLRKLRAYEATWTQDLHRQRFAVDRFRVLTVTTSKERAKNLAAACAQLPRGHGLFLFTDLEALKAAPDVFSLDWISGRGKPERLVNR